MRVHVRGGDEAWLHLACIILTAVPSNFTHNKRFCSCFTSTSLFYQWKWNETSHLTLRSETLFSASQCCCVWNSITAIELVSHLVCLSLQKLLAGKYFNGLKSSDVLCVFVQPRTCTWTLTGSCQLGTGCWSRAITPRSRSSRSPGSWSRSGRLLLQRWMSAAHCWRCLPASTRKQIRYKHKNPPAFTRKAEAPLTHICTESCHNVWSFKIIRTKACPVYVIFLHV